MAFDNLPITSATPEQMAAFSKELLAVADRLEASGDVDWFKVSRAACFVDSLRFGFLEVRHGHAG